MRENKTRIECTYSQSISEVVGIVHRCWYVVKSDEDLTDRYRILLGGQSSTVRAKMPHVGFAVVFINDRAKGVEGNSTKTRSVF